MGDPYDNDINVCIEVDDKLCITLQNKGNKLYLQPSNLTVEDMEACNHIEIARKRTW